MVTATYYADGKLMANGHPYRAEGLTCADNAYPLGTRLLLTRGGRSVVVTVTDRGCNHPDLSIAGFKALAGRAWRKVGRVSVTCRVVGRGRGRR